LERSLQLSGSRFGFLSEHFSLLSLHRNSRLRGSDLERVNGGVVLGRPSSAHPSVGYLVDNWGTPHCTGNLIAPNVVLAAAHCWDGPSRLRFVPGEYSADNQVAYDPKESGDDLRPFAHVHPEYDGLKHDLGYMVLSDPVREVTPATVAAYRDFGSVFDTVGYGKTTVGPSDEDSGRTYERKGASLTLDGVDDGTGWLQMTGIDGSTCSGDSGAGLFAPDTEDLVGVLHGGNHTGQPCALDSAVRYTPIAGNEDFVNEALAAGTAADETPPALAEPPIEP
jgi:V8-like Glu-specific endopeptidase